MLNPNIQSLWLLVEWKFVTQKRNSEKLLFSSQKVILKYLRFIALSLKAYFFN